jgi:hypothetical protein
MPVKPSKHEPEAGEWDESEGAAVASLMVIAKSPAAVDPDTPIRAIPLGSLQDPSPRDDSEALGCGRALGDIYCPRRAGPVRREAQG